jgi:hypothetical protein
LTRAAGVDSPHPGCFFNRTHILSPPAEPGRLKVE